MDWKYCPYCAGALVQNSSDVSICSECGKKHYVNPKATVGVFLFDSKGNLVLAIRGVEPYKGAADTIGGFTQTHESLEEGMYRELFEETGLSRRDITEPAYVGSAYGEMEFMGYTTPFMTIMFAAHLLRDELVANDDVAGFTLVQQKDIADLDCAWPVEAKPLMYKAFDWYEAHLR